MEKSLKSTFWALVIVFVFIFCQLFVPPVRNLFNGTLFLVPFAIFFLLGLALTILTIRQKIGGSLKKFLLLTGISSTGLFVFVLLHNAIYALFHVEEPFFFLLAVVVCPLGFFIGLIGAIVLIIKEK